MNEIWENETKNELTGSESDGLVFVKAPDVDITNDMVLKGNIPTDIIINSKHKISYGSIHPSAIKLNYNFFNNTTHPMVESFIVTLFISVSSMAALPYTAYTGFLMPDLWLFFCVFRTGAYAFVFFVYWINFVQQILWSFSTKRPVIITAIYILKLCINCLFAALYSSLYSIKWMELPTVILWQISIPAFMASWFLVYFTVIDKHLSLSISVSGSPSTNVVNRRRKILLSSIKKVEKLSYSSLSRAKNIYSSLIEYKDVTLLIAKLSATDFYNNEAEKLDIYENELFDSWSEIRTSIVNILLGLSILPLTLAMVEDYGHSLHNIISSEEPFLWMITIFCCTLAVLYIIATYPIHHKSFRNITYIFNKDKLVNIITKFITRLPLAFVACVVAAVRLNASYAIFGKMVAKFRIPYSLGMPILWTGVCIVFFVDYGACMKIVSYASKRFLSIICARIIMTSSDEPNLIEKHLRGFVHRYFIRYHTKNLKWIIRNCDEDLLGDIVEFHL